jgi:hypothetical protein
MKVWSLLFFLTSLPALAQNITLDEFKFPVPDISHKKLNKEKLFTSMNRSLVRTHDSICSNRAHMWVYDFKRKHEVEAPKIFLFFTSKTGSHNGITWWYHVSPMVNENGNLWVMDAGFPNKIKNPMAVKEWLVHFTGEKSVCKEIKPGEDDLVENIYKSRTFPENTRYGKHDCYYKIVPPGYWTPAGVAKHLLGKDENGRPVNYVRDQIDEGEVFEACLEAATSPFGWAMRSGVGKCNHFLQYGFI